MKLAFLILTAATAFAQTGRIEGVVLDSASHQPIKKAAVSIMFMGPPAGGASGITAPSAPNQGSITTDSTGSFAFAGLSAGQYQVVVTHQTYPQARMGGVRKTVQVSASETASSVTVELTPGAFLTGNIVDEDGDPLNGCIVQLHQAKNPNQGVMMAGPPMSHLDGSYKLYSILPGKYIVTAQCSTAVFQPRPLSEGPDPPPSAAYPIQFYPAASDIKSAQVIELMAGAEKSGVDFQMRPAPVTHIQGTLVVGSADWHGRTDLRVQLLPLDPLAPRSFSVGRGGQVNAKDGTFSLRQVFPGSYRLAVFSQNFGPNGQADLSDRAGAIVRVDVSDKPVELTLALQHATDVSGTVEVEQGTDTSNQITPTQINIQLTSENQFGLPPPSTQVNDDGSFTIKSVLPGEWRIRTNGRAFLKSARLGSDDVTNKTMDLSSGVAQPLRIVVSTNTATIRGTAPPGQAVYAARIDSNDPPQQGWRTTQVDPNGQFTMQGLTPGKYRVVVMDNGSPMPDEGGQEITVAEGETKVVDLKPETKP